MDKTPNDHSIVVTPEKFADSYLRICKAINQAYPRDNSPIPVGGFDLCLLLSVVRQLGSSEAAKLATKDLNEYHDS